ncbi:MAG: heme-binding domain-containing protein, partial [Acidimicrobiia bacterium]
MWRAIRWVAIGVVALALGIQLIPYGHDHQNPPVTTEPAWDSQQTLDLAKRACFDCHSNETKWAWYTNIAPMSWLIQ